MNTKVEQNFETPNYTGYRYNGDLLTIFYSRFGKRLTLNLSGEPLAAALKEVAAIEGYDTNAETGDVMVLHTTQHPCINAEGDIVMIPGYDGEPLHVWMHREFFTTEAKAVVNIHEAKKDEALMKRDLTNILDALKLGGEKGGQP